MDRQDLDKENQSDSLDEDFLEHDLFKDDSDLDIDYLDDEAAPQSKSVLLIALVAILAAALIGIGTITILSLSKLASMQQQVTELQALVENVSDVSTTLSQQSEELQELNEEAAALGITDTSDFAVPSSSAEESEEHTEVQGPMQQAAADSQESTAQQMEGQTSDSSVDQSSQLQAASETAGQTSETTDQTSTAEDSAENGTEEQTSTTANNSGTQTAAAENTEETTAAVSDTMDNQGMLSPAQGDNSSIDSTDESMEELFQQLQVLLPTNNGNWSVYVCNLARTSENAINDQSMQAASLIKLFIMGAVYENYDSLSQSYGADSLESNIKSMITVSDNDCANTLVSWLGGGDSSKGMEAVNAFCKAHGYTSTSMGRLLLASNANGDNYTSVSDCGRFLKEVYEMNNGISTTNSLAHAESMYYYLKLQERRNKIPAQLPDGVQCANKTGELDTVENDAGIIYDTGKVDLVIVFMSENLSNTSSAQNTIAELSRDIYGFFNEY